MSVQSTDVSHLMDIHHQHQEDRSWATLLFFYGLISERRAVRPTTTTTTTTKKNPLRDPKVQREVGPIQSSRRRQQWSSLSDVTASSRLFFGFNSDGQDGMSTDVISMSFSEKKEEKKKPKSPATPPSDGCLMFQLVARANQKTLDVLLGRHRDGCIIDTTPTQSSPSTSLLRLIFLDSHTGTVFFQSFYVFLLRPIRQDFSYDQIYELQLAGGFYSRPSLYFYIIFLWPF